MGLLLDTHIWLWSILSPDRLAAPVKRAFRDQRNEIHLSSISVWEVLLLAERGRVKLDPDPFRWLKKAMSSTPVVEEPITIDVVLASRTIDLENQDPADRFIAATACVHGLTLVTADAHLLRCRDIDMLPNR